MMEKPILIVSACLLGVPCRFDGKSKTNDAVIALKKDFTLVPICPEAAGGLKSPRPPAEQRGKRIIDKNGKDVTDAFLKGSHKVLARAKNVGAKAGLLKANSPSCGVHAIYDGSFSKTLVAGQGTAAKLLSEAGLTLFDETELERLDPSYIASLPSL